MRGSIQEHLSAKDAKDAKKSKFIVDPSSTVKFSQALPPCSGSELLMNISALPLLSSRPLRPLRPLRTRMALSAFTETRQ